MGFDKGSPLGDEIRDIAVFLNDGHANFIDSTLIVLQERTNTIKLSDVDNDSDLDIIFGAGSSGIFPLRLGINSNGMIDNINEITEKAVKVFGIDAADINKDGVIDIIASDQVNSTNNLLLLIGDLTTIVDDESNTQLHNTFLLYPNYPNPFNPETNIRYDIKETGYVSLEIFDILGSKVKTLVGEVKQPGTYQLQWDSKNDNGILSPSGVYIMSIKTTGKQITRRMMLLK